MYSNILFVVILITMISFVWTCLLIIYNFTRIAVFILDQIDTPLYDTAYMIATTIYQHPEQWEIDRDNDMEHPTLGKIRFGGCASSVYMVGTFGVWGPGSIEKQIIWNAIQWHKHHSIHIILRKQLSK